MLNNSSSFLRGQKHHTIMEPFENNLKKVLNIQISEFSNQYSILKEETLFSCLIVKTKIVTNKNTTIVISNYYGGYTIVNVDMVIVIHHTFSIPPIVTVSGLGGPLPTVLLSTDHHQNCSHQQPLFYMY